MAKGSQNRDLKRKELRAKVEKLNPDFVKGKRRLIPELEQELMRLECNKEEDVAGESVSMNPFFVAYT